MMYSRAFVNGRIINQTIKLNVVKKRKRTYYTCEYITRGVVHTY